MKQLTLKASVLTLLMLAGCSAKFETPTVSDAPQEFDLPEAIGEVEQKLDTQGFFQARGYYRNNDTVAGDCLVGPDGGGIVPVQVPNTGGQEVTFRLRLVESSKDVQESMSIDAAASAKFLVAGGDAKFRFAESAKLAETTATLLVTIRVENTAWTVPPGIRFAPDVEPLLRGVAGKPPTPTNLARFRSRCGDGFVHSYTTGGEYFALIQVETKSKTEAQSIKAHLEGNYLTYSASADFQRELNKVVSNSKTLVHTYQIGGEGATAAPCSDVECVNKRIGEFTTAVTAKPVVFSSVIKPYTIVKLPGDSVRQVDITTALDQMQLINTQRNATRDLITQFMDVLDNPDVYVLQSNTLSTVSAAINDANYNLNALNDALRGCGRTPTNCKMPASELKTITTTVPETKPLPPTVVLRHYEKPSTFIVDGGALGGCDNPFLRIGGVEDRAGLELAKFNIKPGVNGALRTISFEAAGPQTDMTVRLASPCSKRVKLTVPQRDEDKNQASFYRERGLNGKPNTWSFRLYGTPGGETLYLTQSRVSSISVTAQPPIETTTPGDMDAFKNAASWYMEQP